LVDALGVERDLSRTPLFQVFFNYLRHRDDQRGRGESGSRAGTARFDLSLKVAEVGDGLVGTAAYSTALFDETRIVRMLGHFQELLAAVAADADRPLSQLALLTADERAELAGWSGTRGPVPDVGGVHELFQAQAAMRPDAVAVVSGDVALTYA